MPSTFKDGKLLPEGCECMKTYHRKHPGSSCGAMENLFPMPFELDDGKKGVLWLCKWCHEILCIEGQASGGKVPI